MSSRRNTANGRLYVVATPIGNLGDISPRALDVLRGVAIVLAEDTRTSGSMLRRLGLNTSLRAFHEHNERRLTPAIIDLLKEGKTVALISDAGTPLISDPGYHLVRSAHEAGIGVTPIPGPSAVLAALAASGLATNKFVFEGFLPNKPGPRQRHLRKLNQEGRTMVFFEAPHRVLDAVTDMVEIFGGERKAAIARELTKVYESIHLDTLANVHLWLAENKNRCRGEIVIVIEGAAKEKNADSASEQLLAVLLRYLSASDAAAAAAELTGKKRNQLYQQTLALRGKRRGEGVPST